MVIDQPGAVSKRITLLGRKESCVYLLDGAGEYALLGGGFAYIAPDVVQQLNALHVDEEKIRRLVVLHSHFDHCGIVPFLKKRWPWLDITASGRAKIMFSRPKVIENIIWLNQMMVKGRIEAEEPWPRFSETFRIGLDTVVEDGACIPCGDRTLEVIAVPGHSSCSIAVYVPEEKAMFSSDAAGIPFGDGVLTAANSNYDDYVNSLQKLGGFDIRVILAEHNGARSGEDCRRFMEASLASAFETRQLLEESLDRTGDVEQSTAEITEKFMAWAPDDSLSKAVISLVVGQMMNYISRIRSNE